MRWSYTANWAQQGLNAAFTFLLAALLGPAAFGIAAIATLFVMFTHVLVTQGLNLPLIQHANLTRSHLDSAFWALLAWSIVMALAAAGLSDWWGAVNGDPLVAEILLALCPVVVIQSLYVVPKSQLVRELNFRAIASVTVVSSMLSGTAGVAFALGGAGVWSLVVFQWVAQLTSLAMFWFLAERYPGFSFSFRSLRELLYTGSGGFLTEAGGFAIARADSLLIGVFFGPVAVGLYRLADRLVQLLVTLLSRSLTTFALPFLSRAQGDPERLRRGTADCLELSSIIGIPPLALLATLSPLVVDAIGDEWQMAWIAVVFLCAVGVVQSVTLLSPQLMNAAGRSHLAALISWSSAAIQSVCFVFVGYACRGETVLIQIAAISGAKAAIFVILVLPFHLVMIRLIAGVAAREVLGMLVAPLACALVVAASVWLMRAVDPLEEAGALVKLGVYGVVGSAISLGSVVLANRRVRAEVLGLLAGTRLGQRFAGGRRGRIEVAPVGTTGPGVEPPAAGPG